MVIGELEYDNMVEAEKQTINGSIVGKNRKQNSQQPYIGTMENVTIEGEWVPIPFPVTDHIFIFVFVFLMSIIMINLLFGLAVSDVQVIDL